ncbi:hypothetical protein ACE38U_08620 [Cedecea sp. S5-13]|uniref:hypothetical protein n=1 Tax=Cedecea selenatireducens TaxID=3144416 RepID=UPI0035CD0C3C
MTNNKGQKDEGATIENRGNVVSLKDGLDTSKALRLLLKKQEPQQPSETKKKVE